MPDRILYRSLWKHAVALPTSPSPRLDSVEHRGLHAAAVDPAGAGTAVVAVWLYLQLVVGTRSRAIADRARPWVAQRSGASGPAADSRGRGAHLGWHWL